MAEPAKVETLRILNEEVTQRLATLRDADQRIETKLILVLGFALTLIQFLLVRDETSRFETPAVILFILAAVASFAGIWPRSQYAPPDTSAVEFEREPAEVLEALVTGKRKGLVEEKPRATHRRWFLYASVVLLIGGAVLGSLHLALGKTGGTHHERRHEQCERRIERDRRCIRSR